MAIASDPVPAPATGLDIQVSLGYKLLLGLAATMVVWVLAGFIVEQTLPVSPWRNPIALAAPLAITLGAGAWFIRRLRLRFERAFQAALQLSGADWETPIAISDSTRLSDETDVMLAHLELLRRNTQQLLGRINEAGGRVHTTSVGLSQTAQNLYHDIGTFSTALESLRQGAEDQSRMADGMQAAMDGISGDAQNHRKLAGEAEESGEQIRQKVVEDGRKMGTILQSWEATLLDLRRAGEGIADFEDTAREIGAVVGIIAEVAQRTHTLSLNASLEAIRAGDEGEGFAVLAVEIRSLSEDTSRRAQNIAALLAGFLGKQRTLLGGLREGIVHMDTSRQEVGTIRTRMQEIVEGIDHVVLHIVRLSRGFEGLAERIATTRSEAETVHRISRSHAELTRDTVGETRNQMLVGADQLLHEGRNLDRIARDLNALVREIRGGGAPS